VSALIDRSASELRRLVATREVTAVDVVEAALQRIEQLNGTINAVVTVNERAVDEARAVDSRIANGDVPLLCGLPAGIKDVTPVAALRTTFGSTIYADHVPDADAIVVQRLRAAGAVIVGKTNCPEFAAGGNTFNEVFGRTRNPWNTALSAGGSTGGGAAALATGMIALAEGTDLGGSLRIPASFCGVVGLRPSVGLVPTSPTDWLWDTLQVSGPMARTAQDVALMLQVIAGPTAWSPLRQPVAGRDFMSASTAGLRPDARIAYCADPAHIGIDPDVERVCRATVRDLKGASVSIDEIDLDLSAARKAFLALRGQWFATEMLPHMEHASRFGSNVANNVRSGLATSMGELAAAEQERNRIWLRFRELFEQYDALLAPCMAVPPFPVERNYPSTIAGRPMETYIDWIAPTFVLSLTGLPVGCVPCGLDRNGLPVGLQIVGRPADEESVLSLAAHVERTHPIGRPPLEVPDRGGDRRI
jgi:amidase